MKRYNHLYLKIYDPENIFQAHQNAKKGKKFYEEVQKIDEHPEIYVNKIHDLLKQKTFKNAPYVLFQRKEGRKIRDIAKLPYYPDRIIHHCIMNVLEPIYMKLFVRDTYSSMKGRGIHDGVKRMKGFLRDRENTTYCLKLDVKKYYPSIDHDILKRIIRQKIKCKDTLWLLDEIIDSAPGLPIGNYLSQYFANLYLTYFDHWIKETQKIKYYARYCDDIVVLHSDKSFLHGLFHEIETYLAVHLNLQVKSNWQVFPVAVRGIDFLGYRFFGTHTLIRKSISTAFQKRIRGIVRRKRAKAGDVNAVMSYFGWFIHADGRHLWVGHSQQITQYIMKVCKQLQIRNPLWRTIYV